ncbi:MAG: LysE family translocator [Flavobacteriaceae bacterium]|jgi:threonine/homoserine/homoserine lactone efflux protein|nr:LysE family translocator [Flavobacteriaceae bacterium]MDP4673941.1 LysE family translocator [Flavobacteriaceae bacterium]MDP4754727.1 LysE family translocator [Flavobacteriaceae bacterium]MDP4794528.1 LysE family translocator [Flavobacteriaceae bacterium]MDP4885273.1 LysE family translocator [Flavobacteriaceae bacterium]
MELLWLFLLQSVILALMPGPDILYVAVQSMVYHPKKAMAVVFGLVTGCLWHTLLVSAGVSTLLFQLPWSKNLLLIFGAIYFFYLAIQSYRAKTVSALTWSDAQDKSGLALYGQGFLMNALNPKVALFFMAFFPGFLYAPSTPVWWQMTVLGLIFSGVTLIVFSAVAFAGYRLQKVLTQLPAAGLWINRIQAIVLLLLGVFLLYSLDIAYF